MEASMADTTKKLKRKLEAAERALDNAGDEVKRRLIAANVEALKAKFKAVQTGTAAAAAAAAAEGLSQNALKKLGKRQSREKMWKQKKELKKRKRQEERTAECDAVEATMDDTARQAWNESQRKEKPIARRPAGTTYSARWAEAIGCTPYTCVIDMRFEERMTEREKKSLAQQVMYSYGSNRRAKQPWKIVLSSLDADGVVAQQLAKNCGFHQWPGLSCTSESYLSLPGDLAVRKEQLVYLTADSPTEIDVIEPGLVYILGGIVDRNRYPALTYNLAVAQGVKTARLPLTENGVQLLHGTSVLTVNHMLDILLFATQAVGALAGDLATAEGDEKASVTSATSATALVGAGKVDWRAALLAALPSRKGVVETVNPSSATLP